MVGGEVRRRERKRLLEGIADDLKRHRGGSWLPAPASRRRSTGRASLNAALGNVGQTVVYAGPRSRASRTSSTSGTVARMERGEVQPLVLGSSPVYDARRPGLCRGLFKVATRIYLSRSTTRLLSGHVALPQTLPRAWGDAADSTGRTASCSRSALGRAVESNTRGGCRHGSAADTLGAGDVKGRSREELNAARKCLHDGVLEGSAWPA